MTSRVVKFTTANTTNLRKLSDGPIILRGGSFLNTAATAYYVKFYFYNPTAAAPTPTVGTTVPDMTVAVPAMDPATGADGQVCPSWPEGVLNAPGQLYVAVTNLSADGDTTAVAAGQGILSILLG